MNKIVITGASGFLGSHLIKKLCQYNDLQIYALSSTPKIVSGISNVQFFHKDVIDTPDARAVLEDAILVNCAFPRIATGEEMADGLGYIKRLFMKCRECKSKAIINISSQSVYSQTRLQPADELTNLSLDSAYAIGKYATELMLEGICSKSSLGYTNIRLASLIGTDFEQRIVNRLVKAAWENGEISVNNNQQYFGFMDVEDAVDGICVMIKTDIEKWGKVYNLGIVGSYTLIQIAEKIQKQFKQFDKEIHVTVQNGTEQLNTALNATLFYTTFGFVPQVSLEESIKRIMQATVMSR